jgi:hypothetical protein
MQLVNPQCHAQLGLVFHSNERQSSMQDLIVLGNLSKEVPPLLLRHINPGPRESPCLSIVNSSEPLHLYFLLAFIDLIL